MGAMRMIADLMEVAARTAPKAKGEDFISVQIIEGEALGRLADAMDAYGRETGRKNFDRDGRGIRESSAVLLVGLKGATRAGLNCGACGQARCAELPDPADGPEFAGPQCAFRLLDLGIALGSAAKTAGLLNADSRLMYRAGVLARRLGMIEADLVIGVPISASGKNIYFDRPA